VAIPLCPGDVDAGRTYIRPGRRLAPARDCDRAATTGIRVKFPKHLSGPAALRGSHQVQIISVKIFSRDEASASAGHKSKNSAVDKLVKSGLTQSRNAEGGFDIV
jgi:hypothetical protein